MSSLLIDSQSRVNLLIKGEEGIRDQTPPQRGEKTCGGTSYYVTLTLKLQHTNLLYSRSILQFCLVPLVT